MLRRLFAALLVAAIAMPFPAVATATVAVRPCPMQEHAAMGAEHRCCCNESAPAAADHGAAHRDCGAPASTRTGCDCSLKADPGTPPATPASASFEAPAKAPVAQAFLIPADRSTPQTAIRAVHLASPPPSAGLVSRPRLCTWTL